MSYQSQAEIFDVVMKWFGGIFVGCVVAVAAVFAVYLIEQLIKIM